MVHGSKRGANKLQASGDHHHVINLKNSQRKYGKEHPVHHPVLVQHDDQQETHDSYNEPNVYQQ